MDIGMIAAFLLSCKEDELMKWRLDGAGGAVVIGPDGRKHKFTADQLAKGEIAMNTPTIAEVAEASAEPEAHAPEAEQTEPQPSTKRKTTRRKTKS